jgi:hypothetical protein
VEARKRPGLSQAMGNIRHGRKFHRIKKPANGWLFDHASRGSHVETNEFTLFEIHRPLFCFLQYGFHILKSFRNAAI